MKAVVISEFGDADVLKVEERQIPKCSDEEILIKVKAAGINRPDIFQRKGKYPAPANVPNDIPGLEVAGIVAEIGNNVQGIKIGDRVMALVSGAGYAEYVSVHESISIPIPSTVSFEEAAGMPETLYTVWHNVFQRGKLKAGETFLVHGGAGGIGSTAIQLAKLFGAKIITTVSSDQKKDYVIKLGADIAINYNEEDFFEILGNRKVDVILDSLGGEYFDKNINVLNEEGRLVYINAMQGPKVELNLLKMMQKRIHLTGSTLRNRSVEFKGMLTKEILHQVLPLINSGQYKTNVFKIFDYQDAVKAHELMESRDFLGKIILKFD